MDPRFLRFLSLSLTLLVVVFLLFFPVNDKHVIESWRPSTTSPHVVQDSILHEPASAKYPLQVTTCSSNQHSPSPPKANTSKTQPLKIAIIESMGWHDEVYAALVHAFGSQPNVELSLFFANPRWGMPELLKTFKLPRSLPDYVYHGLDALDVAEPDIIVSTTCEYDIRNLNERLDMLFEKKQTYLFCTAHYANEWNHQHEWLEPSLTKWMEAGLMSILTLSPHVQKGFHEPGWGLSGWDSLIQQSPAAHVGQENEEPQAASKPIPWPPIELFVPVFPIPDPTTEQSDSENSTEEDAVAFAMQGGVNSGRNYTRIISYLDDLLHNHNSSFLGSAPNNSNISLYIIRSADPSGSPPQIPDSVAAHIIFDPDPDYPVYYAHLAQQSALIPALAGPDFLTVKASSSIPASVIVGIPLVATREILTAYSYLGEEDVYVQEQSETELDVIWRVVAGGKEGRREKRENVQGRRRRLVEGNVRNVEGWVEDAMMKIRR